MKACGRGRGRFTWAVLGSRLRASRLDRSIAQPYVADPCTAGSIPACTYAHAWLIIVSLLYIRVRRRRRADPPASAVTAHCESTHAFAPCSCLHPHPFVPVY